MWGGKREGAGRKKGSHKGEVRKNRTIRATKKEYLYIARYAKLLKNGYAKECEDMVKQLELHANIDYS